MIKKLIQGITKEWINTVANQLIIAEGVRSIVQKTNIHLSQSINSKDRFISP